MLDFLLRTLDQIPDILGWQLLTGFSWIMSTLPNSARWQRPLLTAVGVIIGRGIFTNSATSSASRDLAILLSSALLTALCTYRKQPTPSPTA